MTGVSQEFLDMTHQKKIIKEKKTDTLNFIKVKTCPVKTLSREWKDKEQNLEKIFANHTYDKGLDRELSKRNSKKMELEFQSEQETSTLPQELHRGQGALKNAHIVSY